MGSLARQRWRTSALLCLLAFVFVASVTLVGRWSHAPRLDLTEDGLYTLSPGTVEILHDLQHPITLTLYFSRRATDDLPRLRSYDKRVHEMLVEMANQSNHLLRVRTVDPVAYSGDEDRALGAGLIAMPGGSSGERVFFGLAGKNAQGKELAIPFFDPNEESFLEYSLSKLVYELSLRSKPRLDIISSLPIDGDKAADMAPWAVMRPLQQLFDVHMLDAGTVNTISKDTKALMVIHPKHLPDNALYALDQYVLRGGKLIVFVDPNAEMDALSGTGKAGSIAGTQSSLPKLFKAWGVDFDPHTVVLDRSRALSVTLRGNPVPVVHPAVLELSGGDLNQHSEITANLRAVDVSTSGHFELRHDTSSRLYPLIQTGADAMLVPVSDVQSSTHAGWLLRHYHPSGEHYVLATLVRGKFASAFPQRASADGGLTQSNAPQEVVLVADTDVLSNRMWVQPTPFLGRTLLSAFASNGDFVTNLVDYVSGSSALISIHRQASSQRPFTRVQAMRRTASAWFRQKERSLEKELAATEQQLAKLKPGQPGHDKRIQQQIDRNLQRKLAIRKELRQVQHQLNLDIDRLGNRLEFINIFLIPIVLTLVAIVYGIIRSRRRRRRSH